jgi:hypothetical protein
LKPSPSKPFIDFWIKSSKLTLYKRSSDFDRYFPTSLIPTIFDRALQGLVKLALEPEWEARFEPNSFGFRPGRSAHDAIKAIFNTINPLVSNWVETLIFRRLKQRKFVKFSA